MSSSSSSSSSSSESDDIFKNDNQEMLSKRKGPKKRGITVNKTQSFVIGNESDSSDQETENDILYDKKLKD
jgi:hypothetical protein